MTDADPHEAHVLSLPGYRLRAPGAQNEWNAYHAIRRKVLFENRGLVGMYDEQQPDEFSPGHYPLVLERHSEIIGVIRVDIEGETAIFRRVAIRDEAQRRGHGRILLALAEVFARRKGCNVVKSFVNPGAVGFYERCGFSRDPLAEPYPGHVPMLKALI